jgi:hypothetical protein
MKPPYTSRQGQFLAYINHYLTLHGRPPAEAEMMQFFGSSGKYVPGFVKS